jgi:hypothetical protein
MMRAVRPSTPADAEAIVALLEEAGLRPNVEPQHLHWKYWEPRADWARPRSFVLTAGSEAIAHGALVPGTGLWGAEPVTVVHIIDWAARRSAAGAGAALIKHIGQQADALLAIGGSTETLAMLPHLGFRTVGSATGYVRALRPLRLFQGSRRHPARALARFARGSAQALAAPRGAVRGWQSRLIGSQELGKLAALLPRPARGICVLGRSAGLFGHALACPIAPMQLHLVEEAGRARGYFLLSLVQSQVRIADCWIDSGELADWCAMIECAVARARGEPRAAEIVSWASDALQSRVLEACGFRARHASPVLIRPARECAMPGGPLRLQMLDNDAAYLHERRRQLWT